jgi:hypothetical protein
MARSSFTLKGRVCIRSTLDRSRLARQDGRIRPPGRALRQDLLGRRCNSMHYATDLCTRRNTVIDLATRSIDIFSCNARADRGLGESQSRFGSPRNGSRRDISPMFPELPRARCLSHYQVPCMNLDRGFAPNHRDGGRDDRCRSAYDLCAVSASWKWKSHTRRRGRTRSPNQTAENPFLNR